MSEVLSRYRLLQTVDVEEARTRVSELFAPHRLNPLTRNASLRFRLNAVQFGAVGLAYLGYGSTVRVISEPAGSYVKVQIPTNGRVEICTGRSEFVADARTASVPDPDTQLKMTFDSTIEQLVVVLDRNALTTQLQRILGRPPKEPLQLNTSMDLTTPAAQSWLGTVHMLRTDLEGPAGLQHPILRRQVEQLIMSQLLAALTHSASDGLVTDASYATPRSIRRADQLIFDHAQEALTVEDLAEAVGLSVRSLQEGFRRHLDTTPTARLREARLIGARAALAAADPTTETVSLIAANWGFHHLGRFAGIYRERWGESPSETLRR